VGAGGVAGLAGRQFDEVVVVVVVVLAGGVAAELAALFALAAALFARAAVASVLAAAELAAALASAAALSPESLGLQATIERDAKAAAAMRALRSVCEVMSRVPFGSVRSAGFHAWKRQPCGWMALPQRTTKLKVAGRAE